MHRDKTYLDEIYKTEQTGNWPRDGLMVINSITTLSKFLIYCVLGSTQPPTLSGLGNE